MYLLYTLPELHTLMTSLLCCSITVDELYGLAAGTPQNTEHEEVLLPMKRLRMIAQLIIRKYGVWRALIACKY
jgi:hypothetical protein